MFTEIKNNKITVEFEVGSFNKDLIDFLTMIEISNKSEVKDDDIKNFSDEVSSDWWAKNKGRLLNEAGN